MRHSFKPLCLTLKGTLLHVVVKKFNRETYVEEVGNAERKIFRYIKAGFLQKKKLRKERYQNFR